MHKKQDHSCKHFWLEYEWSFNKFNVSKQCNPYVDNYYHEKNFVDKSAIVLQSITMCGLFLIAAQVYLVIDPKKKVSAHPLALVAQICAIQALLYYFIQTANIPIICNVVQKHLNLIQKMVEWIPLKNDLLSYYQNTTADPQTITFRLIWFTTQKFQGFLGLFCIILQFFFMMDVLFTWRHPLQYMSAQKHTIPAFLSGAKIGQFIVFAILHKYIRWVNSTLVVVQFTIITCFMVAILVRRYQNHVHGHIIWLIFKHYFLPHLSFCFMIFAIVNQSWRAQFPLWLYFYDLENLIAPVGSSIIIVLMLKSPLSKVCCK